MGKHHGYTPSPPSPPSPAPPAPVPSITASTPAPLPSPPIGGARPPDVTSSGGNGMVWCSGPQAPGWNVSLPNGGCSKPMSASKPTVLRLDQLPYTGNSPTDILLSAMFYLVVVTVAGGFAYKLATNLNSRQALEKRWLDREIEKTKQEIAALDIISS